MSSSAVHAGSGFAVPAGSWITEVSGSWTGAGGGDGAALACPAPTEAQCYEPHLAAGSYFQTPCGQAELARLASDPASTCNVIYAAVSTAAAPTYGREGLAAVPPELPVAGVYDSSRDYIASARIGDHDPGARPIAALGLASSYAGTVSRIRALGSWEMSAGGAVGGAPAAGGALASFDATALASTLQTAASRWHANGAAVETCEEYVFERWWDYSTYEQQAAAMAGDYRGIFEVGYPALADGVQSRSGGTTTWIPTLAERQPKNVFFTFKPDVYPPNTTHYAFDPAVVSPLPAGREYYDHDVAWHGSMSAALAGHPDDYLYALAEKQRDFAKLLAERAAVYKRWVDYDGAMRQANACVEQDVLPLWPWEKLFDPDDIYRGLDLVDLIAPGVFDGVVVRPGAALFERVELGLAPAEVSAQLVGAPRDVGLVAQLPLERAGIAASAMNQLAAQPSDALAIAQLDAVAGVEAMELSTPMQADPQVGSYWGEDGLPTVGDDVEPCSVAGIMLIANQQEAADRVAARLREIDALIERDLERAAEHGCLDVPSIFDLGWQVGAGGASACDWNPEMFVRELGGHFATVREQAFRTCQTATGGDFGDPGHPIHHATEPYTPGEEPIVTPARAAAFAAPYVADYAATTELVDAYVPMMTDWGKAIGFQLDPASGRPVAGHSASDADAVGNEMFGVSYSYAAGWNLDELLPPAGARPTSPAGWAAHFCGVDLRAGGEFRADGTVFETPIELIEASGRVASESQGAGRTGSYDLKLEILSADILTPFGVPTQGAETLDAGLSIKFDVVKEKRESREVAQFTFPVAGIPVTVRAGVAGAMGLSFQPALTMNSVCPELDTTLSGSITPFAQLDVEVSGGVNLAIVEIGLQIALTLLKLELPLTLNLRLYTVDGGKAKIMARPRLEMVLTTLAGKLKAYVRPVLGPTLSVTLFAWDGVELGRHALFAPDWDFSLGRVALGFEALGGE